MNRKVLTFICFIFFSSFSSAKSAMDFLPLSQCDQTIKRSLYSLCYSYKHRIAQYAVHWLSRKTMGGSQSRTNDYRVDRNLSAPVGPRDYSGSGFDRGHLVPAADMKINYQAMSETFFMTNMTPQRPGFNRGIWQSLERTMRKLVASKGSAYVVTAPILANGLPSLPKNIAIPESYYKIAYFPKTQEMRAYLIPNFSQKGRKLSEFLVSVDEIETLTDIDFFSQLPDTLEDRLEALP